MKHTTFIVSTIALVWLSCAGCVPAEEGESVAGTATLGELCGSSLDCAASLRCLGLSAGSFCVQPCQDTAQCGPSSICTPIPGLSDSYCSLPEASPDPDQDLPDPDPMEDPDPIEDPQPDDVVDPQPEPQPEPEPDPRAVYPAGPYGTNVGDTVEDHRLFRPDGTPFTFGEVFANQDTKVLLVFATASWCGRCAGDMPDLMALDSRHGGTGLKVIVSIFEDRNYQAAQAVEAGYYQRQHGLPFDVVADPSTELHQYFDEVALPMVMAVDVDTMRILRAEIGWNMGIIENLIQQNL